MGGRDVSPQDGGLNQVVNHDLPCATSGTATIVISGTTIGIESNGVFDAGEKYVVTYSQCTGPAGLAQLNGTVELDVNSVSSDANPVTAVQIVATNLTVSLPQGSVVANGTGTLSRSSVTVGNVTTNTSTIAAATFALATSFNSRSGSYAITNLSATRVSTVTSGIGSGSQLNASGAVSGTANNRTFSFTSNTNANAVFDATGTPTAADWTVIRSDATLHAVLAGGTVTLTADDASDGSIDDTWTFSTDALMAAAG